MRIACLAEKDLRISLVSPVTYVLLAVFSLICAYFFFNLLATFSVHLDRFYSLPVSGVTDQPNLNEWVIEPYFRAIAVMMIFFIPLYIVRLASTERSSSMGEFLSSLPLGAADFVFSRFFVLLFHQTLLLSIALAFPLVLCFFGNPEVLPIVSGIVGLFFCVMAYSALSMCVAFFLSNPIAAGVISFFLLLLLYTLDFPAESLSGDIVPVLRYLSPMKQLEDAFRGVIELRAFVYFISISAFSLFLSWALVSRRREWV